MTARALRILLVANDGLSAGHVTRAVAIARGLWRRAAARGIEVRALLLTSSEAHAIMDGEPLAVVRVPAPAAARRAGIADAERRRLVAAIAEAAFDGFGPDLAVADTFPAGPHGELLGIGRRCRRALVRRAVADERADALTRGMADHDLAILADDPFAVPAELPIPVVRVPPIVLPCVPPSALPDQPLDRAAARAELGLPASGRAILVACGGGGDAEAVANAAALAAAVARLGDATAALALGPLAAHAPRIEPAARVRAIHAPRLSRLLAAFDGAIAPAGYNTAHELAAARVPAALFARPRPFDDQAARAARLAAAGYAHVLAGFDDGAVAAALAWMTAAPRPALAADGADRAADALIDLATGARP
ncbi:MAG TPA: hypothetical protein VNO30_08165 [Kofleriaceae bacterium]|nr:hypothetical protein [Kofleriaceae bacterium]